MGQMGQQIWMGHVGHGSVDETHLTRDPLTDISQYFCYDTYNTRLFHRDKSDIDIQLRVATCRLLMQQVRWRYRQ